MIQKRKRKFSIEFNELPKYLITMALSKTEYKNMISVKLVCKKWNECTKNEIYYMEILKDYCRKRIEENDFKPERYNLISKFDVRGDWEKIFEKKKMYDGEKGPLVGTKVIEGYGFYEGELMDGKMEGKGCLYKKGEGLIYQGEFKYNLVDGKGERFWLNGDTYIGQYIQSKKEGYGVLRLNNGEVYKGEFKKDKKEGFGELKFPDGRQKKNKNFLFFFISHSNKNINHKKNFYKINSVYKGEWKDDMTHGRGIYQSKKDGSEYEGDWEKNERCGFGVLKNRKGKFKGGWKNNKANGFGEIFFHNGNYFKGEMLDNFWQGKGKNNKQNKKKKKLFFDFM